MAENLSEILEDEKDVEGCSIATCRICLQCADEVKDEGLISPCMCKGTQQFVHRSCLDHWRSVKVIGMLGGLAYLSNHKHGYLKDLSNDHWDHVLLRHPILFYYCADAVVESWRHYHQKVLTKMLETPDPQEVPAEILVIEENKCIFQFHFNTSNKIGSVDFTLDNMFGGVVEANGTIKSQIHHHNPIRLRSKKRENNVKELSQDHIRKKAPLSGLDNGT
ncbi:hypothetical protein CTI12_AA453240 [Artemisia annua]|uniref:RING-CH-type domain-containing protein n=1 Tax=Artemisia annua TaxID=35608 RepID=A0A2U1LU99_ARTAN|nr:hypothetical protein CTI12_AA453240 [Artemisia annua]